MSITEIKSSLVQLDEALTALEEGYNVYAEHVSTQQAQLDMFQEGAYKSGNDNEELKRKIAGQLDKAIEKAEKILYA